MASRMYLLMFYYSYLDLLKSTFTITGQKLKMASGGELSQNKTLHKT